MMCHAAPRALALALVLLTLPIPASAQDGEGPRAGDVARTIELAAMRALHTLGRAHRIQDRAAISCLDPRVSELTAVYRQASYVAARARRAESAGDDETARRETDAVRQLARRARILERRVLECVGEEREVAADWTETEVERVPTQAERDRVARRYRDD